MENKGGDKTAIVQTVELLENQMVGWEYLYRYNKDLFAEMPAEIAVATMYIAKQYPMLSDVLDYLDFTQEDLAKIYLKSKFFLKNEEVEKYVVNNQSEYDKFVKMIVNLAVWLKVGENIQDKEELLKRCEIVSVLVVKAPQGRVEKKVLEGSEKD